jgi:hypothetical protein
MNILVDTLRLLDFGTGKGYHVGIISEPEQRKRTSTERKLQSRLEARPYVNFSRGSRLNHT